MSTGAAPKEMLPLTSDQKQVVGNLAFSTKLVAGMLLLLGAIQIVGAPVALIWLSAGIFSAIYTILQGVLAALLGLVLLAVSSDFRYLGQLPQYSGNHFRNVAKNLTAFYKFQMALALLIGFAVLIRLFILAV